MRLIGWLAVCGLIIAQQSHATLITSPADPALAGATTITFSELALGTYPSLQIANATFDATGANILRIEDNPCPSVCTPYTGPTLSNQIENQSSGTSFDVFFTTPVSAFGVGIAAINSPVVVSAFDVSNLLLETVTFTSTCCAFDFRGIAHADMAHLLFATVDYVVIDNFMYVAQTRANDVPEPSTFLLIAAGLIGLAAVRLPVMHTRFSR